MSNRRPIKDRSRRKRPIQQLEGHWPDVEKYNGYECDECRGVWITVDLNEGVTPMLSQCFATEGCRGRGRSLGYPEGGKKPPEKFGPVIIEWYRPTRLESYSYEMQEYLRKGGLARRAAPAAPDWVKKIA